VFLYRLSGLNRLTSKGCSAPLALLGGICFPLSYFYWIDPKRHLQYHPSSLLGAPLSSSQFYDGFPIDSKGYSGGFDKARYAEKMRMRINERRAPHHERSRPPIAKVMSPPTKISRTPGTCLSASRMEAMPIVKNK